MRQITKLTLEAVNQIVRDIYLRLAQLASPPYKLHKIPIRNFEAHETIRIPAANIVAVYGGVTDWRIVDGTQIKVHKRPLVFHHTELGYKCVNATEVPTELTNGLGELIIASTQYGMTEFKGSVILKETIYLYPVECECTILTERGGF